MGVSTQMYLTLLSLKKTTLFSSDKKSPPSHIPFSLLQTYISVIICIKTCKKYTFENAKKSKQKKSKRNQNNKSGKKKMIRKLPKKKKKKKSTLALIPLL